ncbi:MAG: hypothetical protein WCO25_02065 [Candidatus Uhrbacteria bacterium]
MGIATNNRGFTYIEAVIYLGVVSLLIGTVGLLAGIVQRSSGREAVRREVEEQGRQALEIITQTTRNASAITAPASGATGASLTVSVDSAPASPTVFSLSGGAIMATEGASAAVPLTNANVVASSLSFQNLSRASTPGTVRVSFTLSGASGSSAPFTYSQTFYGSASLQ